MGTSSLSSLPQISLFSHEEVCKNINKLSVMHTNAMAEDPWRETWSNDLNGSDPRKNSPAMFRKLLDENADFVLAKSVDGDTVGLGVGILLTHNYLQSMEWGRASGYTPRGPVPGDYEMNLVLVNPDYRSKGLMSKLAEYRLNLAKQKLTPGKKIWVQTRPATDNQCCTARVVNFYLDRGFIQTGRMVIKDRKELSHIRCFIVFFRSARILAILVLLISVAPFLGMNIMKPSLIKLSGTPTEIGLGHGESLRSDIKNTWDFYRSIIKADDFKIESLAFKYLMFIEKAFPQLVEEMKAISQGANIEFWKIVALNCRTEIIRTLNSISNNECTLIYSSKINILGQTWDWAKALENLVAVLHIRKENETEILTLTEPGIVGKIGVNSHGVGLGLTILKAPVALEGLPIHILLRACLERSSRESVKNLLAENTLGTTSTLNFIFSNDLPLGIEILGFKDFRIYTKNSSRFLSHKSLYISAGGPNSWEIGPDMDSSVDRFKRAQILLENCQNISIENIKSILVDNEGTNSICHDYKDDSVIGSEGTVCRLILNPAGKFMEIAMGTKGEYKRFNI